MIGRFAVGLMVCSVLLVIVAAAHAETATSGYKNVVSKSYIIPAMRILGYDTWGQSPGWYPAMNGSHPNPYNGTLQDKDKRDPARVPGVYQPRCKQIVIFSSKRRK